jgi:hypothetical protein
MMPAIRPWYRPRSRGVDRLAADRREAILAALARHAQHAFDEIDVLELQLDQLAHADAATVKHFEHRLVAGRQQIRVARRIQKLLDLLEVEALGQALLLLGRADRRQRRGRHQALADEELVERPERRQLPRRRALRVVLRVQVREELADLERLGLHLLLVQARRRLGEDDVERRIGVVLPDLAGQELPELNQVGAVALDGVVGEMLLEPQVVQELLDERREALGVGGRRRVVRGVGGSGRVGRCGLHMHRFGWRRARELLFVAKTARASHEGAPSPRAGRENIFRVPVATRPAISGGTDRHWSGAILRAGDRISRHKVEPGEPDNLMLLFSANTP